MTNILNHLLLGTLGSIAVLGMMGGARAAEGILNINGFAEVSLDEIDFLGDNFLVGASTGDFAIFDGEVGSIQDVPLLPADPIASFITLGTGSEQLVFDLSTFELGQSGNAFEGVFTGVFIDEPTQIFEGDFTAQDTPTGQTSWSATLLLQEDIPAVPETTSVLALGVLAGLGITLKRARA
ncbi:MAG: hypothetical protein ACFBSC_01115 [Microcoleaceae cyanobacterium]